MTLSPLCPQPQHSDKYPTCLCAYLLSVCTHGSVPGMSKVSKGEGGLRSQAPEPGYLGPFSTSVAFHLVALGPTASLVLFL